jgi:predicted metal-dependent peptidase
MRSKLYFTRISSGDQDRLEKIKRFQKLLEKATAREIPELTQDQYFDLKRKSYYMRSGFAAWCARNQMYYTLALLAACEVEVTPPHYPFAAAVSCSAERLCVMFHPLTVELWEESEDAAYFLFVHELRHLPQIADLRNMSTMVDLEPIRDVFVAKKQAATKQEAIDAWQRMIDAVDDPENREWKQKKHKISNITMDVALHVDVMKLFPKSAPIVNKFLKTRFLPYLSGYTWETKAKDMIASGKAQEHVDEMLKMMGPNDNAEWAAILKKEGGITEAGLAQFMQMNVHIQTVDSLEDSCRNLQHYQPTFRKDGEWLYFADQYVRWLAEQIDNGADANSPPKMPGNNGKKKMKGAGGSPGDGEPGDGGEEEGEGSGGDMMDDLMDALEELDSHEFSESSNSDEKRADAERRVREALRRAEEEGKVMAHRAGKQAADSELVGDTLSELSSKMRKIMDAIRIKFIRLHAPSNNKMHSYRHINRLFSEIKDLPGKQKEVKPQRQVVLVCDTSGSMWNQKFFNQMAAFARYLYNGKKLAAFYCCDTQLHRMNFDDRSKIVDFKGGGGTIFGVEHVEQIMKELNTKRHVDVVYLTDEYVHGLEEAKLDKRWSVHVLNLPNILGEH